jgi:hypothetical protein
MLGDLAILILVFVGGFLVGNKFDTLGEAFRAGKAKVEGLFK